MRYRSIPDVSLVKIDLVPIQEFAVFILKRDAAVMRFLIANVAFSAATLDCPIENAP